MDREEVYRVYMTDTLMGLAGGKKRYIDLFKIKPKETRSSEEIIQSIKDKIR